MSGGGPGAHGGPVRTGQGHGRRGHAWQGQLEDLTRAQCLRLLGQSTLGRVVYTDGALPAVTPVPYVLDGSAIVFRAGADTRLAAGTDGAVVAFEADSIDPQSVTGWSVVVLGVARPVSDDATLARVAQLPLASWGEGDRHHVVRIVASGLQGRRLRPADTS